MGAAEGIVVPFTDTCQAHPTRLQSRPTPAPRAWGTRPPDLHAPQPGSPPAGCRRAARSRGPRVRVVEAGGQREGVAFDWVYGTWAARRRADPTVRARSGDAMGVLQCCSEQCRRAWWGCTADGGFCGDNCWSLAPSACRAGGGRPQPQAPSAKHQAPAHPHTHLGCL